MLCNLAHDTFLCGFISVLYEYSDVIRVIGVAVPNCGWSYCLYERMGVFYIDCRVLSATKFGIRVVVFFACEKWYLHNYLSNGSL